jgi:hypothetical protein
MKSRGRALMAQPAVQLDENSLLDVGDVVALRPPRCRSVLPLAAGQSMCPLDVPEIAQFHRTLCATSHVAQNLHQEVPARMPGSGRESGQDHRL